MEYTLQQIADQLGARLRGDPDLRIRRIADLRTASPGDISFLAAARYSKHLSETRASAVIVQEKQLSACPDSLAALVVKQPYFAYAQVARMFHPCEPVTQHAVDANAFVSEGCRLEQPVQVGAGACLSAGAQVGAGSRIGAACVLEEDVVIGKDCVLHPHVTLCRGVRLGDRVIVHPGVVIGADGFGFAPTSEGWLKIPQTGSVRVEDDVEIGANTTIDRGALDDTVICEGVKIDNQVQIAHNVRIGRHTAIAGCVGIAGGVRIGEWCRIGGATGINGHLEITDHVGIAGMSTVVRDIKEPGQYGSCVPLMEQRVWYRNMQYIPKLEEMAKKVKKLPE